MKRKMFIDASGMNDIHTWVRLFCKCYFEMFVKRFFSDRVKKLAVYFDLYQSALHFSSREDQINTVYGKRTCFPYVDI